ncbi:AarF/ABC1/UbiB kinase family protein [Mycolicibacterium sp. P9-64]|uniref:ABC1 kinase family protein n=1 Tax=Mycolicibacterium sp. P9-64 TaxID=2024612 RepID=UPI0011EDEA20|nr:AarF/ABC1/UbiB kinase family protein [Mycolicibacterium sp. P9-64]KAA0077416.1 AarF/ABC1/UbiB kinase family protein [Mycolicibacterium sp. P9-64]
MAKMRRSASSRTAKAVQLPLGIAGRYALGVGQRIAGRDRDEVNAELVDKAAEQLFAVLGELKGGAMKVGQALSVFEAGMPERYAAPYREALTKLQAEAPPMPIASVHRVLNRQLGTQWRQRFSDFDDVPAASASIGQVHRAVWADGRTVAVKVQYPGAEEALKSDLRTLRRFASVGKLLMPNVDVKAVVDELIDRTEAELDYRQEADAQRAFAAAFDGHAKFTVPKVIASAPKVVVSEWMDGRALSKIIKDGTQDERNNAGSCLGEFSFEAPARAKFLHGDPHPGNFMMLADGRMGIIDFGAVQPFPEGLPPELGALLRLAVEERYDELVVQGRTAGFVSPGSAVGAQEIMNYLRPLSDPLKSPMFQFSRNWMQRVAGTAIDVTGEHYQTSRSLSLPPEYAMVVRVLAGVVGVCCQLHAEAPYLSFAEKWLPGYA